MKDPCEVQWSMWIGFAIFATIVAIGTLAFLNYPWCLLGEVCVR